MWFSLFAIVLILCITFYQGLHGLFSSFIMCVLTVLSAALAFGVFEDIYFSWLVTRQPDHGRAIALLAVFLITLLISRLVIDAVITGNLEFPVHVDRALGGLFGLITALIIVGMLTIGFQLLPFHSTFLGFSRYTLVDTRDGNVLRDDTTDLAAVDWSRVERRGPHKVWLNPDGFTVATVALLSDNALAGRQAFRDVYPDFLDAVHAMRAGISPKSSHTAEPDSLTLQGYWDIRDNELYVRQWFQEGPTEYIDVGRERAEAPPAGYKRIVIRGTLGQGAVGDREILFNVGQVRLLGRTGDAARPQLYHPIGISDAQFPQRLVRLYPGEVIRRPVTGPQLQLDFVFEIPDIQDFRMHFVEFKWNARAEVLPQLDRNEERPPPLQAAAAPPRQPGAPAPTPAPTQPPPPGQDRISGLGPARGDETRFSDQMPFPLTQYRATGLELSVGTLRGGRVSATLDENWEPPAGNDPAIERFDVPEGTHLLQLSVEKLQPESWLGQIYGGIIDTIGDFYLIDEAGRNHRPVGAYAMARVGNESVFEIVYLDDFARQAERQLPKFERIRAAQLRGEYLLVYLFPLPPGTRPVELNTGRRNVPLQDLNLVAPSP